ncbi:MAG: cytochrome c [Bacteroidota bacterium]|nr:cytochrome c [Bacteroidota bacterium]
MKKILYILSLLSVVSLSSCSYDRSPSSSNYEPNDQGFEYGVAGDMYHSKGYEGWSQTGDNTNPYNKDSSNMRLPAEGSVARGKADYRYSLPNSTAGYELAATTLVNPVSKTELNLTEGKALYNIYCWHCHGYTGKNDGSLMASGKFPKPGTFQAYQDAYIKELPEGKIYHTITNGKNLMGAHGHLLSPTQRWQLVNYVKYLANMPSDAPVATDSTVAPAPAATDAKADTKNLSKVKPAKS